MCRDEKTLENYVFVEGRHWWGHVERGNAARKSPGGRGGENLAGEKKSAKKSGKSVAKIAQMFSLHGEIGNLF